VEGWAHDIGYWFAKNVPGFESFSSGWEHMLFASHFFFHWFLTTVWILLAVLLKKRVLAYVSFAMCVPVIIAEISNGRPLDWLSRGSAWVLGTIIALIYLRQTRTS